MCAALSVPMGVSTGAYLAAVVPKEQVQLLQRPHQLVRVQWQPTQWMVQAQIQQQ